MLAVHYTHPDTNPFYDIGHDKTEAEHGMKRGGKKKRVPKAKAKIAHGHHNISNVVSINLGKDMGGYLKQNHVKRFAAPLRRMANEPPVLSYNSYAVPPTQISDFQRPAEHGQLHDKKGPWEKDWGEDSSNNKRAHTVPYTLELEGKKFKTPHSTLDVPNGYTIPTFKTQENPSGIYATSSHPQRAIPSKLQTAGGVFFQQPEHLAPKEYGNEDEGKKEASGLVNYFPPRGRDNIPPPADRQFTGATPVDFFPLRGQPAVSREEEEQRSAFRTIHPVEALPYSYSRQGTPISSRASSPGKRSPGFLFKGLEAVASRAASPKPKPKLIRPTRKFIKVPGPGTGYIPVPMSWKEGDPIPHPVKHVSVSVASPEKLPLHRKGGVFH